MESQPLNAMRQVEPRVEETDDGGRPSAALIGAVVLLLVYAASESEAAASGKGRKAFRGPVPIVFEENAGQTAAAARFVTRQGDLMSWFGPTEIVFGVGERGSEGTETRDPSPRVGAVSLGKGPVDEPPFA